MPDKKVPPHRVVLAREAMERRHVIIVGQTVDAGLIVIGAGELARIAARLQQQHRAPALGQPSGKRSASGAGADNDVIERAAVVHWNLSGRCVTGNDESALAAVVLLTLHGVHRASDSANCQNVFRNAISAFLSASPRSEPK